MLRIRGKTHAVLGHNESGKTSLIQAMAHLDRNGFAGATEFTDRTPRPPNDAVLSARFEIEDADVAAITKALEGRSYSGAAQAGQTWTMTKHANGGRYIDNVEGIERDFSSRGRLASVLDQVMGRWDSLPIHLYDDARQSQIRAEIETTKQHLITHQEGGPLPESALDNLTSLKTSLDSWLAVAGDSPNLAGLSTEVSSLEADERADHPGRTASLVLFSRMPSFLMFDNDARLLPSFTAFSDRPSAGLVNLLAAGGTTFSELASLAGQEGGQDALNEEELQVNRRLELFFANWSQREVTPAIRVDTTGIRITGRDRAAPILDAPLSQRSEGMRMFAALAAFLQAGNEDWASPPVLLVDEAELHLHYDAQADLVRLFERQEVAQCVVYTTHSVGCLPEDLGLGLVVVEECGEERSQISQAVWTRGPGLTPIMLALGATALSFTPARRVLIGEGAHEAILLPSLLRQAREHTPLRTPLGFQIVGGLAEISERAAASLEEEAGTVVYVVDNDAGGRAAAAVLPAHVRNSGRIFTLGEGADAICIEDFVAAEILASSIADLLSADGLTTLGLTAADVPPSGRAKWAVETLEGAGSNASRTRLAQSAVLAGADGGLVEPNKAPALRALLSSIEAVLPPIPAPRD
jgi:hypothetical protein